MAEESQEQVHPPYLQSIESSTTTQPRFSDVSRPSDGLIQVEPLRLTPAASGTIGTQEEEDRKDEDEDSDDIQPSSPYPNGHPQITVIVQDDVTTNNNNNNNDNILRSLEHLRAMSAASFDHDSSTIMDTASSNTGQGHRVSTPYKNTNNNKKLSTSAFKKTRKTQPTISATEESNTTTTATLDTIPSNASTTITTSIHPTTHERSGSLGTIHSNAGTIGTMDVREYQQFDNTTIIRPHITDKKIMKKSPNSSANEIIKDDAASEIPPLPHSSMLQPIVSQTLEPIMTSKSAETNMSRVSTNAQQDRESRMKEERDRQKQSKGMYLDDAVVDIDNIQFDDEVDLTQDLISPKGRGRGASESTDRRKSGRSVRFHDASRNTFMSPLPKDKLSEETAAVLAFPDTIIEAQNSGAPMRFRGPARIALNHKYVPIDPFEGDTEIMQWSVGDVNVWIRNLEGGVSVYARNFTSNHIKGQDLLRLTDRDLYDHLGVKSLGHRQIIMQSIDELRECVMVEINQDRFLVPPDGAVMRFEDVSVQERRFNETTQRYELQTILGHATGTFLPNQITAIMGDTQKSLLMKVLSGYGLKSSHHVSGHIFINGNCIDGSLVNAGLASYINGDDTYSMFTRTTVSDLVTFYVKLSGNRRHSSTTDATPNDLVNHVLRISDINYPSRTQIAELKPIQYKRLMIAIDTILFDIKLVFLDKILDGLTYVESQEMMQMIYSFSRRLDITFILSVERIRYHILNAYFDQVIVVGGVDPQKIIVDCNNYYKNAMDMNDEVEVVQQMDTDANVYEDIERNKRNHQTLHNDLMQSATSVRFVGRPEDVMEYFKLKQVEFMHTENPIEVIFEHVLHNVALIEPELEEEYFRYRKKSSSLNPFTSHVGPRNSRLNEIWIVTQFVLMVGWREWSLLYSCARIIVYCVIVGTLFWDVSCSKYFLNERLLAIFVISCIPMGSVWPMLDFQLLHRDFWVNYILFRNRARVSSFVIAMLLLSCTHAVIIGLFSFIPWVMEDLGCNDVIAFIRIGFMQFAASMIFAVIALFGAEIFAINGLRILSVFCTASVLFSGALVHAGHLANRPGVVFISFDFLKYSLEFLLFTDVDYIQVDACQDYLQSLDDRQFYDREPIDILVIFAWFIAATSAFVFALKHELRKAIAYSSQFDIGRMGSRHKLEELEMPSLPHSPNCDTPNSHLGHVYTDTSLTSFGMPTPIQTSTPTAPRIPVLPLHITPLTSVGSQVSHAVGAFTRIPDNPSPRTPAQLQGPISSTLPASNSNTTIQNNISHHSHQISLSGLETIREKKTEELPAVPPSTTDSMLLRQQRIASGIVPPNVRILSTSNRASMISHPDSSRYSNLTAFTPLRQQSLVGRVSFSNRRRSSVNMKSQSVPRFLAIQPAESFQTLPGMGRESNRSPKRGMERVHFTGKESLANAASPVKSNRMRHSESVTAVNIPFEQKQEEEEHRMRFENHELSAVPESASISRVSNSNLVLDEFTDHDLATRMRSSPLIFYNLVIVDRYKQLLFNKVSGHVIENGVSVLLSASNINTQPLLRAIAGVYNEDLLYMEGKIVIHGSSLLSEMKLAQNRVIAYVPEKPVLPDLITVREIIRLAFILTEGGQQYNDVDTVRTIITTMELTHVSDMRVSQLSRMDYFKVAIAYCGLRSKAGVVLIENIYCQLNIIEQKQLIRCVHRLSHVHKLSILTTMYELTLESIQQDHINHMILLSGAVPGGVSPIYEGTIQEALQMIPKLFTFRKYENVMDELLDISCKTDSQSLNKLCLLVTDLRQSSNNEMISLAASASRRPALDPSLFGRNPDKKWLEYWWLGWLYWRFVSNHRTIFFIQVLKLFVYVFVVCSAFWKLPSTVAGSKSMFGAMNALLFTFIMQTPANHRLFAPLLRLGIQDWQGGKYSLNMMSTLHCWSQYLLSIVLATMTSVLSYWAVNFADPATAISYSIVLFTMGFVYSAGVWDSIYFVLFAVGCSETLSFFIMAHLLLYFWLFSGCFILKGSMPLLLRYIGYYANPVRLTLESQYCAIILPKTFGNERGEDILAKSDYDCAIGFDLCLVFLITFVLRIAGAFILSYRYESIPLYNNGIISSFMNQPNDYGQQEVIDIDHPNNIQQSIDDDDDDDDDDIDIGPAFVNRSRSSHSDTTNGKKKLNISVPKMTEKNKAKNRRSSRHKGHGSVDHISMGTPINVTPKVDQVQDDDNPYMNMDHVEQKKENSLIKGFKNLMKKSNKATAAANGVGLLDHTMDIQEDDDDDDSDSELRNLENEYRSMTMDNNDNETQRVQYITGNNNNDYSTMVLGTGADDSDDMLL
eukprot:407692_1